MPRSEARDKPVNDPVEDVPANSPNDAVPKTLKTNKFSKVQASKTKKSKKVVGSISKSRSDEVNSKKQKSSVVVS